jgi:hypothetical protein
MSEIGRSRFKTVFQVPRLSVARKLEDEVMREEIWIKLNTMGILAPNKSGLE